jgi:ABC-type branched-subunit amino acid transport system substrate-binding protein
MRRRDFIKTGVGVTGLVALAGCSGGTDGSDGGTPTDTDGGGDGADGGDGGGDGGTGTKTDAGTDPIQIGSLHALAPPLTDSAKQERRGVQLAVKQINEAGGIGGREVQATHENTNADPKTATEKAQRLVSGQGVSMLYGANLSPSGMSIAGYTNEQKVPYFTAVSSIALTGERCQKSTFMLNVDEMVRGRAMVPTILERSGSDGWLQIYDFAWGHDIKAGINSALEGTDGKLLGNTSSKLGATDFSNVVSQISSANPDWAYIGLGGGGLVAFLKQANQFGLRENVDLYGPAAGQPTRQAAGESMTGFVAHSRYTPTYESSVNTEFINSFKAEFDVMPNDLAKDAWEALHLYKAGVESAGSTDFDDVVSGIEDASVEGPVGTVSLRNCDHACERPIHVAEMVSSEKYGNPVGEILTSVDSPSVMRPCEETGCTF